MENRSLKHDERCGDGVFNRNLNSVREVLRNRWHSQQICGPDKEVAVERRHAQVLAVIQ
jgi:hypothetical protein